MKKTLITLFLFLAPVCALMSYPAAAFAFTITPSPLSAVSGSENTIGITYAQTESYVWFNLFDGSGNNVSGNFGAGIAYSSPKSWAQVNFPTGLAAGNYYIEINQSGNPTDNRDSLCGAGTTLTLCAMYLGGDFSDVLITITAATPSSTPATALDMYNISWFLVAFCMVGGIIYVIIRLIQLLWNYL